MKGFTKTGQPIMGRTYIISQGDILPPTKAKVVGKIWGQSGVLLKVMLEEPGGARTDLPWPIEASDGAPPIEFHPA